ncbi:MAG TPA: S41 family peptidase [Myxococcota bacterium]|nr:S41 family peptidase [Myxococcota bacterium]
MLHRRAYLGMGAAAGALATLAVLGLASAPSAAASPYAALSMFAEVLRLVRDSYVTPVEEPRLIERALRGMLAGLDPHSAYLEPAAAARLAESASGEFAGVGLEIARSPDGYLQVVTPIEGSPAAQAGLRARDRIVALCGAAGGDCASTRGLSADEGAALLRGAAGTLVTAQVLRDGWDAPAAFALERGVVKAPAVRARLLEPGFGYARVAELSTGSARELAARVDQLARENAAPLAGLVLDLRDNPGGVLEEAIAAADLWLTDGAIVSVAGRSETVRHDATPAGDAALPLVVLVNGGSASTAEIVAAALQERGRALVLGAPSFGKGSVQRVFELPGGAGVRLTTAYFLTPTGRSLQSAGVTPDIVAASEAPTAGASAGGASAGRDVQLARALETLKSWRIFGRLRAGTPPAPTAPE